MNEIMRAFVDSGGIVGNLLPAIAGLGFGYWLGVKWK